MPTTVLNLSIDRDFWRRLFKTLSCDGFSFPPNVMQFFFILKISVLFLILAQISADEDLKSSCRLRHSRYGRE